MHVREAARPRPICGRRSGGARGSPTSRGWLFVLAFATAAFGIASPAYFLRTSRVVRRRALGIGLLVGLFSGCLLASAYQSFLLSELGRDLRL